MIAPDDPRAGDVRALLARHLAFAHANSEPRDVHALDVDALTDPSVSFFSARADGELLGVGALKRLDATHAEIKSMHTAEAARGRGIGRAMVEHLLGVARERGFRRVSLETGSGEAFAPARALYASAGFAPCGPFGDYARSEASTYLTLWLDGPPRLALSWSGGKDSALALQALRAAGVEPAVLLTTVDEESATVAHHGVSVSLLERQAAAVGVPLTTVAIPARPSNGVYEQRLRAAFAAGPLAEVDGVAFGDLFLEDLRAYREARMSEAGLRAEFPLWGRDTAVLAREFIADGFAATLVSVDGDQLPHALLGRAFDAGLLADLPPTADPCGENGEFHTFVTGGPVFSAPIAVAPAQRRTDGRFAWLALR
ncbi:MAG TPA: GNAT family N-acetyltransferase [Capillimicrobium sp.]|nr:GNAT family N-acetyltransferase [Capillimicrobium sp.]